MSSDSVVVYRRSLVILCAREVTCPFRTPTKHAWSGRRPVCRAVRRAIIVKISVDGAVDVVLRCVRTRQAVVSCPRRAAVLARLLGPVLRA
jgi:hypothetical protein